MDNLIRYNGPAGAILVALAACIATSNLTDGQDGLLWWGLPGASGSAAPAY